MFEKKADVPEPSKEPKQKKRISILVSIVSGLVVTLAVNFFLTDYALFKELTGVVRNKIVYPCGSYTETQLCIINADGTGARKITERSLTDRPSVRNDEVILTGFMSPIMNDRGQIATYCFDAFSSGFSLPDSIKESSENLGIDPKYIRPAYNFSLCAINSSGKNLKVIREVRLGMYGRPIKFALNGNGTIWYDCSFRDMCRERFDSSLRAFDSYWNLEEYHAHFAVNGGSHLVFGCYFEDRPEPPGPGTNDIMQICIKDQMPSWALPNIYEYYLNDRASQSKQLTDNDYMNRDPIVNNKGRILFLCNKPSDWGICIMNADGSGWQRANRNPAADSWDINNQNVIVGECYDGEDTEICVYDNDLSKPRMITQNDFNDQKPAINDQNIIAYICDYNLCVINADGTGQRQFELAEEFEPVTTHAFQAGLDTSVLDIR